MPEAAPQQCLFHSMIEGGETGAQCRHVGLGGFAAWCPTAGTCGSICKSRSHSSTIRSMRSYAQDLAYRPKRAKAQAVQLTGSRSRSACTILMKPDWVVSLQVSCLKSDWSCGRTDFLPLDPDTHLGGDPADDSILHQQNGDGLLGLPDQPQVPRVMTRRHPGRASGLDSKCRREGEVPRRVARGSTVGRSCGQAAQKSPTRLLL